MSVSSYSDSANRLSMTTGHEVFVAASTLFEAPQDHEINAVCLFGNPKGLPKAAAKGQGLVQISNEAALTGIGADF